jgi:hypothetical protein
LATLFWLTLVVAMLLFAINERSERKRMEAQAVARQIKLADAIRGLHASHEVQAARLALLQRKVEKLEKLLSYSPPGLPPEPPPEEAARARLPDIESPDLMDPVKLFPEVEPTDRE